jgi:D-glycero-alpha-D-manno-heptose-7-phosphate kinase
MRHFIVRSPHRVSLFGGGTDFASYIEDTGFSNCIGFAINAHCYVSIRATQAEFLNKYRLTYSRREEVDALHDIQNLLIRHSIGYVFGETESAVPSLDITYSTDIPTGTGMGTSSAFAVALIYGLMFLKNRTKPSPWDVAKMAYIVERKLAGETGGYQDHYFSALGGGGRFTFGRDAVTYEQCEKLNTFFDWLTCNSVLIFTKERRRSTEFTNLMLETNFMTHAKEVNDIYRLGLSAIKSGAFEFAVQLIAEGGKLKERYGGIPHQGVGDVIESIKNRDSSVHVKLLGAGGGGALLVMGSAALRALSDNAQKGIKITRSYSGVELVYSA